MNVRYSDAIPRLRYKFGVALAPMAVGGGGSLTHGQSFTVNGSGYGTRSDYNVGGYTWQGQTHIHYRWCDFANTMPASGSSVATFEADNAFKGFQPGRFESTDTAYASYGLSQQSGGPSQSGKYLTRTGSGTASEGYISFDSENASPVPATPQGYFCHKQLMSATNGKYFRWWANGHSGGFYTRAGYATRDYESSSALIGFGGPTTTSFKRVEWMIVSNATYTRVDGTVVTWNSGSGFTPPSTTLALFESTDPVRNGWYMWINTLDSGVVGSVTDIYFDWTAARVEVTDGSKTEIQILTSWSSTQINGVFNKGELSSGAGTLKVYNASDSVIDSQAVTIA